SVVTMLDSSGKTVARTITNESGRFRVADRGAGRELRVTRIGYRPKKLSLGADATELDIVMVAIPTLLEPVQISSGANCDRRDDRQKALSLLEQARAGLLSAVVAREVRPAAMVRALFQRTLDGHDRAERQEVRIDSSNNITRSFLAVRPPAEFVRLG